eukprot:gene20977-27833_t
METRTRGRAQAKVDAPSASDAKADAPSVPDARVKKELRVDAPSVPDVVVKKYARGKKEPTARKRVTREETTNKQEEMTDEPSSKRILVKAESTLKKKAESMPKKTAESTPKVVKGESVPDADLLTKFYVTGLVSRGLDRPVGVSVILVRVSGPLSVFLWMSLPLISRTSEVSTSDVSSSDVLASDVSTSDVSSL